MCEHEKYSKRTKLNYTWEKGFYCLVREYKNIYPTHQQILRIRATLWSKGDSNLLLSKNYAPGYFIGMIILDCLTR